MRKAAPTLSLQAFIERRNREKRKETPKASAAKNLPAVRERSHEANQSLAQQPAAIDNQVDATWIIGSLIIIIIFFVLVVLSCKQRQRQLNAERHRRSVIHARITARTKAVAALLDRQCMLSSPGVKALASDVSLLSALDGPLDEAVATAVDEYTKEAMQLICKSSQGARTALENSIKLSADAAIAPVPVVQIRGDARALLA